MKKDSRRLPRKAGPGPDGSRFEHWRAADDSGEYADLMAAVAVRWARGEAPEVAYELCRLGRLLTPAKATGGLRPLAITAVFRRIVLRAICTVATPRAAGVLGESQYAIGKPSGVERLFHAIRVDHGSAAGRVVVSLDLRNAFGTLSRGVMAAAVAETFPELAMLTEKLYRGDTDLLWEGAEGTYHSVAARAGVGAGCPWSVFAFCLSVRRVLLHASGVLEQNGVSGVRFRAYMDDVYAVCHESQVSQVLEAFRGAAAACGMELNDAKLQLWGVGPGGLPEALRPHAVLRMQKANTLPSSCGVAAGSLMNSSCR